MQIGSITLPGNIVLSPMAGVTDAPFREICRQNGADYTISEMVTSNTELWDTKKTKDRLSDAWATYPKIIQIAGASPDVIQDAALKCVDIGADIIEINMGCPAKKVCNVLAGSALLKDEALVKSILEAAVKAVKTPIILKTRLGWDSGQKNIMTIAKIAEGVGIKGLTIHGRTRADLYNGYASYELIKEVKSELSIPVLANGDIDSPEKALEVLKYTNADGVYVGRGSLGRPWLFKQIKDYLTNGKYTDPTMTEIIATIQNHHKLVHEHYDEYTATRIFRKHMKWYCLNLFDEATAKNYSTKFNEIGDYLEQVSYINLNISVNN